MTTLQERVLAYKGHLLPGQSLIDDLAARIDTLEAEVARLREALETCIRFGSGESHSEQSYLPPLILDVARAALKEQK
jgi:hypothetical protein